MQPLSTTPLSQQETHSHGFCKPQAFAELAGGKAGAMGAYNAFQVKQLTRLIEVTRTNLSRSDRQKVRLGGGRAWSSLTGPACPLKPRSQRFEVLLPSEVALTMFQILAC